MLGGGGGLEYVIFFTMNPNLTCKKKLWGCGGAGGQRGGGGPRVSEFFTKNP